MSLPLTDRSQWPLFRINVPAEASVARIDRIFAEVEKAFSTGERIALLVSRIDHDRGDCAGAIAGLERFLAAHPESTLRRYASTTLAALQERDAQCG